MSEEFLAINHIQRKLNPTVAIHGSVLGVAQTTGQSAQLVVANPNAAATQTIAGPVTVTGNAGLPAQAAGSVYWAGGYGNPVAGRLILGDGSGWKIGFAKRTGSVTTDVGSLDDSGNLTLSGTISAAGMSTAGNLTVTGNLTVNGTTTHINSTTVDMADRILHLNSSTGTVGVPTLLTGLAIHRGNTGAADRERAGVVWDEAAQSWTFAFTAVDDSGYGTGGHVALVAKQLTVDANPTANFQVATKIYVDNAVATGGGSQLLAANNTWTGTNTFSGPVKIQGNPASLQLNNAYIYTTQANPSIINFGSTTSGTPIATFDTSTSNITFPSSSTVSLPAGTTIGGAAAGGTVTLGALMVIAPSSANVYPFPYTGKGALIFAGGMPQILNSDYVDNGNGTFSFTPALPSPTPEVTGTAVASGTATGAASHFTEQLGDGSTTAFTLPGSGQEEIIMVGRGYLAKRGTQAGGAASGDYYIASNKAVFFTAPAAGQSVMISCAVATVSGSDATTVGGFAPSYFATATQAAANTASITALGKAKPFARLTIEGDLSTIPSASLPAAISPPFLNSGATRTISKIVIYCPQSGTGSISLDVMFQAVGAVSTTAYATNPGSRPTLTGNSGLAATVITGANLPSNVTLADLTAIFPKLLTIPNNSWNDLVVEFYE